MNLGGRVVVITSSGLGEAKRFLGAPERTRFAFAGRNSQRGFSFVE